jgi:hypothetical protein
MPRGKIANDPTTPYFIYEYSVNGKVFYVGITWSDVRANRRWGHVKNLLRHEAAGTLKPDKRTDLYRKSNQVIAALIKGGHPEHQITKSWHCVGSAAAEAQEPLRIRELALAGCRLANDDHNPSPATVQEILAYLNVPAAT